MKDYDHKEIEAKWRKQWVEDGLYKVEDKEKGRDNFYTLVEFAYPSGNLHIGHWYAFAVPDMYARYKRMRGYNSLFPFGFDAFGLPAENAAIKHKVDPKKWTYENIANMREQLQTMGASFDWSREVVTADPEYYRWTQWLFLQLYKKGLAYRAKAQVNWCPKDQTVLANEQVVDGKCERCGADVEKKEMNQWMLKISDYADRLLADLEDLDWPPEIKQAQRAWIGKSDGAEFEFKIKDSSESIKVFTTRADTLFGVTYIVLAPEKVAELDLAYENKQEVEEYIKKAKAKKDLDRQQAKEKIGVELVGVKAVHPATGEELPIWVADYALGHVGTGALMAVPAHDDRDFEFAKRYKLPIKQVIIPELFDAKNPPLEGKKNTNRDTVHVILRNPENKKILIQFLKGEKWKGNEPRGFVIGGIEDGENEVETAVRELREETGYINVAFVEKVPFDTRANFFAAHKDVNRRIHVRTLIFDLVDEEQVEIEEDEYFTKDSHEMKWVSEDKVGETLTIPDDIMAWKYFCTGGFAYPGEGMLTNSGKFSDIDSNEVKTKITKKYGRAKTTYRLRDWGISRQRYWGVPIPIVYDEKGKEHPVADKDLPWMLPEDVDYTPDGTAPLTRSSELKQRTEEIFGEGFVPEVDTMDTFVDSAWYFLRYLDPKNEEEFCAKKLQKKWMPVDMYSGGAEHTTMHLLYSRFFIKAMHDLGLVLEAEPYKRRMNRSIILADDGRKMSKRWGNVVDPDKEVERVGADSVRTYLAFIGSYNEVSAYPWSLGGLVGVRRFLERVWKLGQNDWPEISSATSKPSTKNLLNRTIKKVGEDLENFKTNTAISAMMILVNAMDGAMDITKEDFKKFLQILAPFAPHVTEELWHQIGETNSIHLAPWPEYDENLTQEDEVNIVIQVNGKKRGEVVVSADVSEDEVREIALSQEDVQKFIDGEPKKVVYVKGRLINIVV